MWFRGSVFICICLWMVCGDPASFSAEIEAHFSESIPSESDLSKSTYLDPNSFRREGPEIQVLLCWNDFELLKVVFNLKLYKLLASVNMFVDKLLKVVEVDL